MKSKEDFADATKLTTEEELDYKAVDNVEDFMKAVHHDWGETAMVHPASHDTVLQFAERAIINGRNYVSVTQTSFSPAKPKEAKRVATKTQAERKKKEKPVEKGWTLKPTSILSTNGSGAKVQFSVENAKLNLLKVSSDWKNVIHAKGFIATLTHALGSPDGLHAQSFYYTLARGNDEILTLRLSNHNVNTANHDGKTPEISIVIKSRRQPNRFYPSSGADVREYVYFKEDIAKGDGNTLSLIAKDLADLLDTGQYRDSSGLALVNVSPADRPADALSPDDGFLPDDITFTAEDDEEAETKANNKPALYRDMDAVEEILTINALEVTPNDLSLEELKRIYQDLPSVEKDGREIEFYHSAFKKIYKPGGLFGQVVPVLDEVLEQSVLAYSEGDNLGGLVRPDGTVHK